MRHFTDYFQDPISEAKVINHNIGSSDTEEVNYGDTLRVYHGFRDTRDAVDAAKVGISGRGEAQRVYSYEANNNPKGIFVSSELKVSKEFTGANEKLAVIAEFHAKESDLEIPVWPSGSYTVQGQMSEYFSNDPEENTQQRKEAQVKRTEEIKKEAEKQGLEWVLESDRPDLAWFLQMGGENQALFTGDLNPNSIRAFWVRELDENGYQMTNKPFRRLSRKEFLKEVDDTYSEKNLKRDGYDSRGQKKIFEPRDDFDVDTLLRDAGNSRKSMEETLKTFKMLANGDWTPKEILENYLWPKQMPAAIQWWDSLKTEKIEESKFVDLITIMSESIEINC